MFAPYPVWTQVVNPFSLVLWVIPFDFSHAVLKTEVEVIPWFSSTDEGSPYASRALFVFWKMIRPVDTEASVLFIEFTQNHQGRPDGPLN